MSPKSMSLALLALWLLSSVVLRVALHRRATGSLGVARPTASVTSAEGLGGVLFVLSLVIAGIGVGVNPVPTWSIRTVVGTLIAAIGVVGTFVSQTSMGTSWRIGVDVTERTALRTSGLFALVRNPIFTAMTMVLFGFALVTMRWLVVIGLAMFIVSIELQVRYVEEPYLRVIHGTSFETYSSSVGRFVPRIRRPVR